MHMERTVRLWSSPSDSVKDRDAEGVALLELLFNRTIMSHHAAFSHSKLKAVISMIGISIKRHTAQRNLMANFLTYSLEVCVQRPRWARVSPGSRCGAKRCCLGLGRERGGVRVRLVTYSRCSPGCVKEAQHSQLEKLVSWVNIISDGNPASPHHDR